MEFPVYRKYTNQHAYFIITSFKTWTEYKRLGKKYLKHDFIATQYPEMLFIKDMIHLTEGFETSSKTEIDQLP